MMTIREEKLMGYDYRSHKAFVFTEQGQVTFLNIRDQTRSLIEKAGAAMLNRMVANCIGGSWELMACVDRMVELGEIKEIQNTINRASQFRVFVSGHHCLTVYPKIR